MHLCAFSYFNIHEGIIRYYVAEHFEIFIIERCAKFLSLIYDTNYIFRKYFHIVLTKIVKAKNYYRDKSLIKKQIR